MTRFEKIKNMDINELASIVIQHDIDCGFCRGDCADDYADDYDCPHPEECCIKWLNEKAEEKQSCRVCGCTWNNACPGGYYWVEADLCSKCAEKI